MLHTQGTNYFLILSRTLKGSTPPPLLTRDLRPHCSRALSSCELPFVLCPFFSLEFFPVGYSPCLKPIRWYTCRPISPLAHYRFSPPLFISFPRPTNMPGLGPRPFCGLTTLFPRSWHLCRLPAPLEVLSTLYSVPVILSGEFFVPVYPPSPVCLLVTIVSSRWYSL